MSPKKKIKATAKKTVAKKEESPKTKAPKASKTKSFGKLPQLAPSRKHAASNSPAKAKAHLLGLGLDNQDAHKRITKGEKFTLLGGSESTHAAMTEAVAKTFEELKRKGRSLESADPREVVEPLHKHRPKE